MKLIVGSECKVVVVSQNLITRNFRTVNNVFELMEGRWDYSTDVTVTDENLVSFITFMFSSY